MQGGRRSRQQQQQRERGGQHIAEPVHAPQQIVDSLTRVQPELAAADGSQLSPVHAQDLDAPQRPAKALLLEAVEGERHQPFAEYAALVDTDRAAAQHPQAGLGILGDAGLVPAAYLRKRGPADQAHGAGEDDGVTVRPGGHRDVEEVPVAEEEPAQVLVVLPVAIVLWGLNEGDLRILEMPDHGAQESGLDQVVRVDDAQDLDLVRQPAGGFVERACLVAGPGIEM